MSQFVIRNDATRVELWSEIRLPFEPQGWVMEMRDTLRTAIKQMIPDGQAKLYARYSSEEKYVFDVENVLFYNVGNKAFSHLYIRHLLFERVFEKVDHQEKDKNYLHNQYYSHSLQIPSYWSKRSILASWENAFCPPLNGNLNPLMIWNALKRADIHVYQKAIASEPLGLKLTVHVPSSANCNVLAGLKSLIDGVIAAFHVYNGSNLQEVSKRLINVNSMRFDEIELNITDSSKAVLGSRDFIQSYRSGIKWNPADDRLVHVEIILEEIKQVEWSISGELFVTSSYKI